MFESRSALSVPQENLPCQGLLFGKPTKSGVGMKKIGIVQILALLGPNITLSDGKCCFSSIISLYNL